MLCISSMSVAGEVPFTFEDRERFTRIEARLESMQDNLKSMESNIDKRFQQVDIRIVELREDMNKRSLVL